MIYLLYYHTHQFKACWDGVLIGIHPMEYWQVCGRPLLGYEWKRCVTTAPEEESAVWTSGKYILPTYLSESCKCPSHECLLLQRCHSGCSGVVPLSLVVSVSGKSSPGSEGMRRRWWWSELLGMAHVFHLLGNSYGSLCNHRSLLCAATWLPCCHEVGVAEMGAARNRTWTTVRLTKKYIKKTKQRKTVNCKSKSGMSCTWRVTVAARIMSQISCFEHQTQKKTQVT